MLIVRKDRHTFTVLQVIVIYDILKSQFRNVRYRQRFYHFVQFYRTQQYCSVRTNLFYFPCCFNFCIFVLINNHFPFLKELHHILIHHNLGIVTIILQYIFGR